MRRPIALSILLGLLLAPHGTSGARSLKQWGMPGSFGNWQQTPSSWPQQSRSPTTGPSTTVPTTASNPTTTAPAPTTTSPTTTTPSPTTTTSTTTTPSPTTTSTPITSSGASSAPVLQDVLNLHNQMRAQHSAPPLSWSSSLAQSAKSWSQGCKTLHSNSGNGENIAWGYSTFTAVVNGWYNEGSQYNYNNPGFSSTTGHFTQIVWKSTSQVGCAVTQCGGSVGPFYVCQYSPPGNYAGQFSRDVSPS